jgi:hypothetical protein
MFNRRLTRTAAIALALGAVAAPTAAAMPIDSTPIDTTPSQNLRSADAQGAPTADKPYTGRGIYSPVPAQETQDLRHSDTRDFAEGRGTFNSPDVVVVKAPAPVDPVTSSGIDWADVGVGAGGLLSIALLGSGGVMVATRRRSVRLAA